MSFSIVHVFCDDPFVCTYLSMCDERFLDTWCLHSYIPAVIAI